MAWRNKSFGTAIEVVWASNGDYATRDAPARIKLFRDFKERQTISLGYTADAIYGGAMLGVRSGQDFVFFYDWESGKACGIVCDSLLVLIFQARLACSSYRRGDEARLLE